MRRAPALRSRLQVLIAAAGGLVFVAALVNFAVWYVRGGAAAPDPSVPAWRPVLIDIALFSGFALHHSVFARTGAKAWIQRLAPAALERSIYVWIASLLFIAVCVWWQPVPGVAWDVHGPARVGLVGVQALAGVFTLAAARRLDVLDLAGVSQVLRQGPNTTRHELDESGPYGIVRHPIYLAWMALVWCAPAMDGTRLVFAAVSTAYLLVAIPFEERDLRRVFGRDYAQYSQHVRWRVLPFLY